MAIILTLGAMLLPAFSKAREKGRRTTCLNNLHQIGLAMLMYAGDNNGAFPGCASGVDMHTTDCTVQGTTGFAQFARMLGKTYISNPKVWVCPSDKTDDSLAPVEVKPAVTSTNIDYYNISYLYIARLNQFGGTGTVGVASAYLLMADESNQREGFLGVAPPLSVADNHIDEGRNGLFTDGHVEWINGTSISSQLSVITQDFGPLGTQIID